MAPKAKAAPAKAPEKAPKAVEKQAAPAKQPEKVVEKAAPKAAKAKADGKATRAFIYGLQFYGLNRGTVRSFLKKKCGPIHGISIRRRWGRRGVIKVLFKSEEAAKRCQSFHGKKVKGNVLSVFLSSAEAPTPKNKVASTLFVSGLPAGTTKKDVKSRFSKYGEVKRVRIYKQPHSVFDIFHPNNKYRGPNSGRRGWKAYVYFADAADARKAATKKAFRLTPRDAAHKLFIAPSFRTIENDKRRSEWQRLVEKAFNPRLLERERQRKRAAKDARDGTKKATKESKARKDSKTKPKAQPKKQAKEEHKVEAKPAQAKDQPKAEAKPAAKPAAKAAKKK